jgi:hypothetical protein
LVKTGLLVGSWFLLEPWGPGLGFFFQKEEGILALSLINIFKVKLVGFGSGSSFLDQWFGAWVKKIDQGFDMSMCKL